jgi:hypothetical protein
MNKNKSFETIRYPTGELNAVITLVDGRRLGLSKWWNNRSFWIDYKLEEEDYDYHEVFFDIVREGEHVKIWK